MLASGGATIAIAFAALALFHSAMFLGSIPLAIVITGGLGGAQSDVGWAFSLCAGLEIVVMGALICVRSDSMNAPLSCWASRPSWPISS